MMRGENASTGGKIAYKRPNKTVVTVKNVSDHSRRSLSLDNLQNVEKKKFFFGRLEIYFNFNEVLRMFAFPKNHSSTHDERIVYVVCPCESPFSVEGVYAKWGANKLQEVNIFCLRK